MKRNALLFAVCLLFAAAFVPAASASSIPIGTKLENFSLKDTNGVTHDFDSIKGEKGTLIVFLSAQCPVVKMYNARINALAAEYKAKGINFIGLYPNATESLAWVKEHSESNYEFTTLVDEGSVMADLLGAQYTPETYYFNSENVLDYHGAIDNDRSGENIEKEYLKTAFDEKLAGKEISVTDTKAFGCSIKRTAK